MMQGLINHLWQSTAFAVAVGLLTLGFRRNRAAIRHGLWLSASVKFLVPFSFLFALGHHLWLTAPSAPALVQSVSRAVVVAGEPFPSASIDDAAPMGQQSNSVGSAFLGIWFCGFATVALLRLRAWRRLCKVVRSSIRIDMGTSIEVRATAVLMEPGVVGWLHPILLLPCAIKDQLPEAQIGAVIAHELCHVRRRDNLAAAIQIAVETIFWFHPLVWWIGARLLKEREKACDEEVLRLGTEPEIYANAILKVCRLFVRLPLACAPGIGGSNLRARIDAILENRIGLRLGLCGKLALAVAASVAILGPLIFGMMGFPVLADQYKPAFEQDHGRHLAFEVASVKPVKPDTPLHGNFPLNAGNMYAATGGLFSANAPLITYIAFAYDLMGNELHSLEPQLPHWVMTDRFDIEARAPEANPSKEQMRWMMRSLLADRFKFAFHVQKRQMPVLALVLAKPGRLGPQLQPHPADAPCEADSDKLRKAPPVANGVLQKVPVPFPPICKGILGFKSGATGPSGLAGRNVTIGMLAGMLSQRVNLGRPIIDATGLKGTFDFLIEYAPELQSAMPAAKGAMQEPQSITATAGQDEPDIVQALRDQLGMKMQSRKAPMDVMVLDHIEHPTAN